MVAFLAAVVGALVGGAASAVGSYVLERHRRRLEVRVEIFRELLPPLSTAVDGMARAVEAGRYVPPAQGSAELADQIAAFNRAAATASRDDRSHVRRILLAWDGLFSFHERRALPNATDDRFGNPSYPDSELVGDHLPMVRTLKDEVDEYQRFLSDRFL